MRLPQLLYIVALEVEVVKDEVSNWEKDDEW